MTLTELVALYLTAVEAMIARTPIQAGNRASYQAWARSAKLGRLTRRIRTKGGTTDLAVGTHVLYARDEWAEETGRPAGWTIWGAKAEETKSVVDVDAVEPVCSLCEGSGAVSHKRGLLVFDCPVCAGSGRRTSPAPRDRVRAFGAEAEVVEVFDANLDGRNPVLVRYVSGAEAMPYADELQVLG